MSGPALQIEDLVAGYGSIEALHGISFRVEPGEVVALLGANGAGKTTTLAAISGLVPSIDGSVRLFGSELTGKRPEQITAEGISLVPEGRRVFGTLTVAQNLRLGGIPLNSRRAAAERAGELFELFPRLRERVDQPAGTLSGGEQQMLAVARALMARPRFLLLDEPSLGLAPIVMNHVFGLIKDLRSADMTMLIVEQNVRRALEIADRAYLLSNGTIVREETATAMLSREDLDDIYLVAEKGS